MAKLKLMIKRLQAGQPVDLPVEDVDNSVENEMQVVEEDGKVYDGY